MAHGMGLIPNETWLLCWTLMACVCGLRRLLSMAPTHIPTSQSIIVCNHALKPDHNGGWRVIRPAPPPLPPNSDTSSGLFGVLGFGVGVGEQGPRSVDGQTEGLVWLYSPTAPIQVMPLSLVQ